MPSPPVLPERLGRDPPGVRDMRALIRCSQRLFVLPLTTSIRTGERRERIRTGQGRLEPRRVQHALCSARRGQ